MAVSPLRFVRRLNGSVWHGRMPAFLFFVALSTAFWLFLTLNEVVEEEVAVPVTLHGVPHDVIVTDELPATLRVTLRDRGVALLALHFGQELPPVVIDFAPYATSGGRARISEAEVVRRLRRALPQSTQIVSVKPDALEFLFTGGTSRRVPVRVAGEVTPAAGYRLARLSVQPESISVFSSAARLDTLRAVYTEALRLRGLSVSRRLKTPLENVRGMKCTPGEVTITARVEQMVEKRLLVPITGVNFPEGEELRTFPSAVEVVCQTGMQQYRTLSSEGFVVEADYREITATPERPRRCRLHLRAVPQGVSAARLASEEVEYLIESIAP